MLADWCFWSCHEETKKILFELIEDWNLIFTLLLHENSCDDTGYLFNIHDSFLKKWKSEHVPILVRSHNLLHVVRSPIYLLVTMNQWPTNWQFHPNQDFPMIKELLKVWIVKLASRVVGGLFSSTFCCSISHRIAQSVREGIHSSCKKLNTQSSNLIKCHDPRGSKCEIRGHTMGAKRSLDNNAS